MKPRTQVTAGALARRSLHSPRPQRRPECTRARDGVRPKPANTPRRLRANPSPGPPPPARSHPQEKAPRGPGHSLGRSVGGELSLFRQKQHRSHGQGRAIYRDREPLGDGRAPAPQACAGSGDRRSQSQIRGRRRGARSAAPRSRAISGRHVRRSPPFLKPARFTRHAVSPGSDRSSRATVVSSAAK